MPTPTKRLDNLSGHRTEAEKEARAQAEQDVLPDRGRRAKLRKPRFIASNKLANSYWNGLLKRMDGLAILDDLDSEMLAGYCSMLARRDQTIILINNLMRRLGVQGAAEKPDKGEDEDAMAPDDVLEAVAKLDALNGKLQALDRNLLQYADKLGLTPTGRVRLAQKRAERAAANVDPDGDLFGD